jgi:SWI/SNF-related matrix-associated actin-dependent regulator 1 of chromatin subfamily A
MKIDLKNLLNWSAPKRVRTSQGERDLLTAAPTPEFSAIWKANKEALRAAGIGWSKKVETDKETGMPVEVWTVMWWRALDAAELAQKAATFEASKAVDADIAIPRARGLANDYLGYQKAGIKFAAGREGTLLGDEMGLGKTIQAIGVINMDPSIKSVIIVCPASLKLNWARELRKWLARPMTIQIVGSGVGWGKADITLINYEMLAKHVASIEANKFDLAVIDESHRVKNPKAACTKAFQKIEARRRIAMTGTPILNRPIELWTTLLWLEPSRWNKRSGYFQKRYCGAFMGEWGWVNDGATNLDELQEVLRTSCMIRRLKKDVLSELPPKIRSVIELEGDANARKAAKAELAKWEQIKHATEAAQAAIDQADAMDDAAAYAKAVEALHDATGAAFEEMSAVRHATALAKVPFALDFLTEMLEDTDEKIIVFAHHVDVVQALIEGLDKFNPVKLVGGMSDKAKQASVDAFQKDPNVRVFVGNIQAAGVGITLTASSHVVFVELDWTPARISQAEDRAHRIGQFDSVQVQHLVLQESLDAYMAGMLVDKQDIADRALDKKGKPIDTTAGASEITVKAAQAQPEAGAMSKAQIEAAHHAMKVLAGVCDGARSWDDRGFNKLDTDFGKRLANQSWLSPKQAMYAAKLANKYRRQLPEELLKVIVGS